MARLIKVLKNILLGTADIPLPQCFAHVSTQPIYTFFIRNMRMKLRKNQDALKKQWEVETGNNNLQKLFLLVNF